MTRAAKTCPAIDCPHLQPCPTHTKQAWAGHQGRHGRMRSGSREQRINRAVMLRDNGLCQCGALATEVDHIVPLGEGGDDGMDNRQAICPGCHHEKTQQEAQRARIR